MKKRIFLIGIVLSSPIQAVFNNNFTYFMILPEKSPWGFFVEGMVQNNQGEEGIFTLEQEGCICCPSMPYGARKWSGKATKKFICTSAQQNKIEAEQQDIQSQKSSCLVVSSTGQKAQKKLEYSNYFINIKHFLESVPQQIQSIISEFPNYIKGQALGSNEYVNFCLQNSIDVSSQLQQVQEAVALVGDVSGYFPNNQFVIALDFTELSGYASSESEDDTELQTISVAQKKP